MIVINFVSEDVVVNENNGTVFVCVMRNAVTEDSLTVPITLTTGSADCKFRALALALVP